MFLESVCTQTSSQHPFAYSTKQLPFACIKCGQRFAQENKKQLHEDRCKYRRFECYLCPHQCFDKGHLNQHMQLKHWGQKLFDCAVCEKRFGRKGDLKKHLATHAKPSPFRCAKCYRLFSKEGDRKAHEERCHRRLQQCYLCKDLKTDSRQLKLHMLNYHTGEKPFPCKLCDARFAMQATAKHHMKTIHRQS
ncbi:zinc finger protein 786-like [Contarinia nasturtii]|uniref:zinc finger protein 786-like n=1 Tax=Contarinia nasturtii TaxID=265458 RepID=UPI0012D3CA7B|nr:zinc finger protein 786-like [Contarinia nasturtii]